MPSLAAWRVRLAHGTDQPSVTQAGRIAMRRALFCTALLLAHPFKSAHAQALALQQTPSETSIHGHVVDPSGGAVAGARVTVASDGPGAPVSSVTTPDGEFQVAAAPGRYT